MLKIELASNGWILINEFEDEEGRKVERKTLFSYDGDFDDDEARKKDLEALIELLWSINEEIGIAYSKHQKYNLNISIEENKV